jgi:hypothetical protein
MSKKILVVYYSQTGQLAQILYSFLVPFKAARYSIETVIIQPEKQYDFPWTTDSFFAEMPGSVKGAVTPLLPFSFKQTSYDLVIFAWQPWFLSPSIPATSVLKNAAFKAVIKDTPVVTVIGARNMWLNANERVKELLKNAGAKLVGNIVLTDRHQNYISGVTILYWMLTGKKDRKWGIFPKPGVSDEDIDGASEFGEIVNDHLVLNNFATLQQKLIEQKGIEVHWDLMFIEARAAKLFNMWANLISKKKNRGPWLVLFKYYLLIALFVVAPVVVTTYGLLFKPFFKKSTDRKKNYYLQVN